VIKSGKMDKIEGTYKLTGYHGKSDYLTEREIELYLVIRSNGMGYYAYKSKTVEPHIAELRCSFKSDPEESGKYSYVTLNFGDGSGGIDFGVVAKGLFDIKTNLNSQKPVWEGNILEGTWHIAYNIDVDFIRVSTKTDLSYVEEEFGKYDVVPYGAMAYNGTYESFGVVTTDNSPYDVEMPEDPFVYSYFDIDVINKTGKMWYMLKSDEKAMIVDFAVGFETNPFGGYNLKFGNVAVRTEKIGSSTYAYIPYTTDVGEYALYFALFGEMEEESILENIQLQYENYLANKPPEPEAPTEPSEPAEPTERTE
jgi:hypothetical protein